MSISLASLNLLLINNTKNIDLIRALLNLGANDYENALINAIQNKANESINLLKTLVDPDKGLTLSVKTYNIELISYFKETALDVPANAVRCAYYNFLEGFDLLSPYVSNKNDLLLCYVSLNDIINTTSVLADNPTNINYCLGVATVKCYPEITALLIQAGATNILECIEGIKTIKNNKYQEAVLSILLDSLN